jgi:hypothetical protein
MKAWFLLFAGLGLFIAGVTLRWTAADFARNYSYRDAQGAAWTTDTSTMEGIRFIEDRSSLLGIGLLVIGAYGWMNTKREFKPRENTKSA